MNTFDMLFKAYNMLRSRLELDAKVDIIKGIATSGSNTTITDTTKNFSTNALANMTANVTIGGVEYIRKITSNTADTITIPTLGADVKASAVVYPDADNEITVVCVTATGANGNPYNVEVVYGEGNNQALAAAFTTPTITVTLATDGNGDPDGAANTGTLVAAEIDALAGFSATVTGTDGSLACADLADVDFSGGIDAPVAAAGCYYGIIPTDVIQVNSSALPTGASTEATLALIKAKTDNIPSDPSKESGKLTALETLTTTLNEKIDTLDAVIDSIKDTDGIKKITDTVDVQLSGSIAEKASAQDTQVATTAKTYTRAAGASQMEVYCESGSIRVRTDGVACTATTGEPLGIGYMESYAVASLSIYYVEGSTVTVVSR